MEVFNFIKQRRGSGGGGGRAASSSAAACGAKMRATTTIATAALRPSTETDDEDGDSDDDGPFFDLQFSVPDEDGDVEEECEGARQSDESSAGSGDQGEFNATASSSEKSCCGGFGGGGLRPDPLLSLSPSDELFFKGRLLPVEHASLLLGTAETSSKPAASRVKPTKLRVLMLGFGKPKSTTTELYRAAEPAAAASPKQQRQSKFSVEEVPIVSLFTRDNSSRSSGSSGRVSKLHAGDDTPAAASAATEKIFSKDALQRYISKIKPLYVRVSKRYGEKLRFSGPLGSGASDGGGREPPAAVASSGVKCQKPHGGGNLPAGLRVVCRRLGKSRSASASVAAVRSPPHPPLPRRRDDSLLEQQDGIQSAIAHCKRSFKAIRESEEPPLVRSRSDPGEGRSSG